MPLDQFTRSGFILWIARHVCGDGEITQQAERIQTALGPPGWILVEKLRTVNSPARRLAVDVDQYPVMCEQMIGHVADDLAHASLLRLRVGAEVVVERVKEVVAVQFIT